MDLQWSSMSRERHARNTQVEKAFIRTATSTTPKQWLIVVLGQPRTNRGIQAICVSEGYIWWSVYSIGILIKVCYIEAVVKRLLKSTQPGNEQISYIQQFGVQRRLVFDLWPRFNGILNFGYSVVSIREWATSYHFSRYFWHFIQLPMK